MINSFIIDTNKAIDKLDDYVREMRNTAHPDVIEAMERLCAEAGYLRDEYDEALDMIESLKNNIDTLEASIENEKQPK